MRRLLRHLILKRVERYTVRLIRKHQPLIIGVTGSVGKTSTKLAIAHILSAQYTVQVHQGNYNTDFGLPLSLFDLDPPQQSTDIRGWWQILKTMKATVAQEYPYDAVVLELGADQPNDIGKFMRYLTPDIGVVTAVAKVHYEAFASIDDILEEKWKLAGGSRAVIYNHDDKRLRAQAQQLQHATGYGLMETDVYSQLHGFNEEKGWQATLHIDGTAVDIEFPVLGQQSVYALTAAVAVAYQLGIDMQTCQERLKDWEQPSGRMRLLRGKYGSSIIDDSYNASPYATVAALDALYRFRGRKIAVLGSMNELGDYEVDGHRMVGKHAADMDMLVTIGTAANTHLVPAALEAGLPPSSVHECNTPYEAGDYLAAQLQGGDVVLVKGSQGGVFAEEAIKPILADSSDEAKLVRQSESWLQAKAKQFAI